MSGAKPEKGEEAAPPAVLDDAMRARLQRLINAAPVFLFMKGNPMEPKCKFSRAMVEILKKNGVLFSAYDIKANSDVREALKQYSQWPTYPQLYVEGKLVGGLDVVKGMVEDGEFLGSLPDAALGMTPDEALLEQCAELVKRHPVMVFCKGSVDRPKCGFTNQLFTLLMSRGVWFSTFDILSNEGIRAAMKKFSNWPTFPQLYVEGKFVGGLDVVKDLDEKGELVPLIPEGSRAKPKPGASAAAAPALKATPSAAAAVPCGDKSCGDGC